MRVYLLVSLFAMPTGVMAMDQIDRVDWGLRAGGVVPNYVRADAAGVVGASVMYRHREYSSLALEADLTTSVLDGDIAGFDYSTTTLAAYLAWRSAGNIYLKLRAGLLLEYVEVGPSDAFGGGLSGGIGAGYRRGDQLFEIELTGVEKAAYMVTIAWYF